MTFEDKWNIAKDVCKLLWSLCVLLLMIMAWLYIIDGLLHEDYMQTIAYASAFALVKLNKIKEKL